MNKSLLSLFLAISVLSTAADVPNLWPMPASTEFGSQELVITKPCQLLYKVHTQIQQSARAQYQETYKFFEDIHLRTFCRKELNLATKSFFEWTSIKQSSHPSDSTIEILVKESHAASMVPGHTDESYTLIVDKKGPKISANSYVGVVRALTTLSQLIHTSGTKASIQNVPLTIKDAPRYPYRGVMIDTARHFIKTKALLKLLDALALNKLNVFHWHISDSDSFPMQMPSHPKMTQGAFSDKDTYTTDDVNKIVAHAKIRGIAIVPELDAPSHTRSWSENPEWANLLTCTKQGEPYFGIPLGMLDVTQDKTYELIKGLYDDLQYGYFKDFKFLHIGADEVDPTCTSNIPNIKEFMASHGIQDFGGVLNYFVNKTKDLVDKNTTRIYWSNPDTLYLNFQENDIVQWWGNTTGLPYGFERYPKNKFILSNFDYFYLDCGMGSYFGNNSWCAYSSWGNVYSFEPDQFIEKEEWRKNVFGGEIAMWEELGNEYTVGTKIWPQGVAFAEKFWSPKQHSGSGDLDVFVRLDTQNNRLKRMGLPVTPASSGYCQKNPQNCFKNA